MYIFLLHLLLCLSFSIIIPQLLGYCNILKCYTLAISVALQIIIFYSIKSLHILSRRMFRCPHDLKTREADLRLDLMKLSYARIKFWQPFHWFTIRRGTHVAYFIGALKSEVAIAGINEGILSRFLFGMCDRQGNIAVEYNHEKPVPASIFGAG